MISKCDEFGKLFDPSGYRDEAENSRWQTHIEVCAECQKQAEADTLLRAAMVNPPTIPVAPDLETLLASHGRIHAPAQPSRVGPRVLLAAYGLAALCASVWILIHIDWPSRLPPGSIGLAMILLAVTCPLALLIRFARIRPANELRFTI